MKKQTIARIATGLSLMAVALTPSAFAASPTVTAGYTPAQLVDFLIPNASSITVVPGSETYVTTANGGNVTDSAVGQFAGGDASNNLPFASGAVLTTGRLSGSSSFDSGILGPNDRESTTHTWNTPGSTALQNALLLAPNSTVDAAFLQFDFTTTATAFSFQYMFASEEYAENVGGTYNDAFAFLLTDLTSNTTINLAKIGSTPVSVNTINNGLNNSGVSPQNASYYNQNPVIGGTYNIEFDGMAGGNAANKLFANATGLTPTPLANLTDNEGSADTLGNDHRYRITMVIADVGQSAESLDGRDSTVDSAVFIGADSFVDVPQGEVPEPSTCIGALALVGLAARKLRRKA